MSRPSASSAPPSTRIRVCWLLALTAALLAASAAAPALAQPSEPDGERALAGGGTIGEAAVVEPGSYEDSVALGESRFYALTLPADQIPAAAIAVDVAPGGPVMEGGALHLGILDADRRLIQEAYATIDFAGSEQRQLQVVAEQAPESGTALATYYVGVALRQEDGAAPESAPRHPVRLVVAGVARSGPAATPSASEAVAAPATRERSRSLGAPSVQPSGVPAGLVLGSSALSFLLSAVAGFLRVRARQAPLVRAPWSARARPRRSRRAAAAAPAARQLTGLREQATVRASTTDERDR